MTFTFFDAADRVLFTRNDAETATWTVEELSLYLLFPYDPAKEIRRGMRVGFTDADGIFQPFEVRKAKTYEPDHYQELTCEHIAVAELTDEVYMGSEVTDETAAAVLADVLEGTLWEVGTSEVSNTSSANLSTATVWSLIRTIESNWNVYINPRVTVDSTGITGRYLDIVQAAGTWRGVRLSVEKNADEVGVTIDDTETATAIYGFGRSEGSGDEKKELTFKDVVWTATADHPAKPAGQEYIEDPAATAVYGRNGRPRFAFWTNSDISDAELLLEKTWEYLKTTNAPTVTIECRVADLYRLGYADESIRLHDTAIVDIAQTETHLQKEIIRLSVDLLDPTATRLTIGTYIPNIIYIDRETGKKARGGGGGGRGNTPLEKQEQEFVTEFEWTAYQIGLRAYQRDMDKSNSILNQAGMELNSQGVLIYSTDDENMIGSILKEQGKAISLVVKDGQVQAGVIISACNGQSSVKLQAQTIDIDGIVRSLEAYNLIAQSLHVTGGIQSDGLAILESIRTDSITTDQIGVPDGSLVVGNQAVSWQETKVLVSVQGNVYNSARKFWYSSGSLTTPDGSVGGAFLTSLTPTYKTLHYLGKEAT